MAGNELAPLSNPDHWKGIWDRAGGGFMIDTGYHAFYLLLYLFGLPNAVTGCARRLVVQAPNKADDNAVCILEYENIIATGVGSYSVASEGWSETRTLYGTEGSLHIQDSPVEPLAPHRLVYPLPQAPGFAGQGEPIGL